MRERRLDPARTAALTLALIAAAAAATDAAAVAAAAQTAQTAQSAPATRVGASPPVVEITATDYAFRAPDAIPAGWTTLRFINEGDEPHLVFLTRLPEGRTLHDYEVDLSGAFNDVWVALREGRITQEQAMPMLGEGLPDWFPEVQLVGGPGLLAAGATAEATLRLEPGSYVMECYVKTEDGEIHYMEGMVRPLTVTESRTGAAPPAADARVTLTNDGITLDGTLTPGRRTFEVHAAENPDEGFGHSVHLARLAPGTDAARIVSWMNWFDLAGLRTPAPAHFVGGLHPLPTGETAYFTADLEAGRYLLVSEATGHLGVIHEFTVR